VHIALFVRDRGLKSSIFESGVRGFTIVELAVVLFVGAALLTAGLKLLTAQMDTAGYRGARSSQDAVKDALTSYLGRFGRLPCPDITLPPDGREDRDNTVSPATCVRTFGTVPYAELGIAREAAVDGWENFLGYGVTSRWTLTYNAVAPANTPQTLTPSSAFFVGVRGAITVNDRSPAASSTPTLLTDSAAAVLVSYGKNGSGAVTVKGTVNVPPDATVSPDERTNANVDGTGTTYVRREYTETIGPYGAFDDLVMIVSATDLTTPLMRDGALTSVNGSLSKAFANMSDTVIGKTLTPGPTVTVPPVDPNPTTFDPWGRPITYRVVNANAITAATDNPNPPTAYELRSDGPDGTPLSSDDIVFSMPVMTLKGIKAKTGF